MGQNGFSRVGGNPGNSLENSLEGFARGKANTLGSLDLDLLSGLGIYACAGLAVDDLEGTKSDQLKGLALFDMCLDAVDHCCDDLFGVGFADVFAEALLDGFN